MTKKEEISIESLGTAPTLGCRIGVAYQQLLSQLSRTLQDAGLDISTNEYLVLRAIYTHGEGQQQCDIASTLGKDKASVCRTIATMVKRGLIVTESLSHKCLKIYLTESGRKMKPAIEDVAQQRHHALSSLVTKEEMAIFSKVVTSIIES